jgi:hypothetical protein
MAFAHMLEQAIGGCRRFVFIKNAPIMKTLFLLCLLLLSLCPAIAQQDSAIIDDKGEWKVGTWYETSPFSTIGLIFTPNMGEFIQKSGKELGQLLQYASLHSGFRFNNSNIRVDVAFSVHDSEREVSHSAVFAGIAFEQTLIKSPRYRFNLGAGIGAYTRRLDVVQKVNNRIIDFNNALNERYNQVTFINKGAALNFNLGIADHERSKNSLGFSYRLGYQLGLKPKTWEGLSAQFSNAPTDRFGVLYLESNILLSRNFKKR